MASYDEGGGVGMNMNVVPAGNGGYGGMGGFGDGWWFILVLLCCGNGMWGGMGGGMWPMMMNGMWGGMGGLYPWLDNSQNINNGFRDQQLSNQIGNIQNAVTSGFGDVQLGIAGLGRQICETGNSVSSAVRDGFYGAEVAAQGRHNALTGQLYQGEINALNRSFQEQTANAQGFNMVQAGLADAKYVEATEACNTRNQASQNTRDIIDSQNRGTQAILDKLCQLELDGVKGQLAQAQRENVGLQNQLNMAAMRESQTAQNAFISQGFANEVDSLYNRLKNCPVGTYSVCNPNIYPGQGCGCNGNNFVA